MFPILLVGYLLELWGKGLLALMPTVALLLAIEAVPMSEFANLGSLMEAYEEPVIIPSLEGIQGVSQWHRISLRRRLSWVGIQLSRADSISIIPFLGWQMSVVTLRWFQWLARPRRRGRWIPGTCQGIVFFLLRHGLQQIQGGGMGLVFQMYHHGVILG